MYASALSPALDIGVGCYLLVVGEFKASVTHELPARSEASHACLVLFCGSEKLQSC